MDLSQSKSIGNNPHPLGFGDLPLGVGRRLIPLYSIIFTCITLVLYFYLDTCIVRPYRPIYNYG